MFLYYYLLSHILSFLQSPFESTRVQKRLAWHVPTAAVGLLRKSLHSPYGSSPSWRSAELAGFRALFSHLKHVCVFLHCEKRVCFVHCETTKSKEMLFLVSLFLLSSCSQRTDVIYRGTDGTIYLLSCGVICRQWASLCPAEGIQWIWNHQNGKVDSHTRSNKTWDCLLHRLSIFHLSFLPESPTTQAQPLYQIFCSRGKKGREDVDPRKQTVNEGCMYQSHTFLNRTTTPASKPSFQQTPRSSSSAMLSSRSPRRRHRLLQALGVCRAQKSGFLFSVGLVCMVFFSLCLIIMPG